MDVVEAERWSYAVSASAKTVYRMSVTGAAWPIGEPYRINPLMKPFLPAFLALVSLTQVLAQAPYFVYRGDSLALDNGLVRRVVQLAGDSIFTSSLLLVGDTTDFVTAGGPEFALLLDGERVDGLGGWTHQRPEAYDHSDGGRGASVQLTSTRYPLRLTLYYVLYPDLPVVRKWIALEHTGTAGGPSLRIEALDVEDLATTVDRVHAVVYHQYARMRHLGRFVGDWHDPLVVVHDARGRRGLALGNEAVGVVKRTAYHTEGRNNDVTIGMTHLGQDFPFRKWLAPGQSWTSFRTFVALYTDTDDAFAVVDGPVNRFVVDHMRLRFHQLAEKPTFVYNTWYPFRTFVNDTLIGAVAEAAAECGLREFVIDDGWQVNAGGTSSQEWWGGNYGDWIVDTAKFRGGLRPSFDKIARLGMKPGLWVSVASATGDARVFKEHPEWFVEDPEGRPGNLHYVSSTGNRFFTASMGTDWFGYIKATLLRLVEEYGLAYAKLDLAIVTSPYVNDDSVAASYATDHPGYRDQPESITVLYERLLALFDELHAEAPELFIDCTFETAGKLHLMDYAIAQHAEGNWLSNFEEPAPTGALRVRHLAWWRSPVLPAGSLVIGNLPMDDPDFVLGLKSLIGTLPIVLGDPRALAPARRAEIRAWSEWMDAAQARHDYMSFRRDLPGFGEPREGAWDGWQRVNHRTGSGGVVGVFRQGGHETARQVVVSDLLAAGNYVVREAPGGAPVATGTGTALMETGFGVEIPETYGGRVYEIVEQ